MTDDEDFESKRRCYVVRISNSDSPDAAGSTYWWDAAHEFGSMLIKSGYGQFTIITYPSEHCSRIMLEDSDALPPLGVFSEETITKLVWDLARDFDFLISCKIDML